MNKKVNKQISMNFPYPHHSGTSVYGNRVWVDGVELPPCPAPGNCVTQINHKVYIDCWEFDFTKYKWKRTLRALWHKFF